MGREFIGKGKKRYDAIEIVYVQLYELIWLFSLQGIFAIGGIFHLCSLLALELLGCLLDPTC